jgi:peptidoglycan hydrolase-like protein with peptidoglycan-binding domain
MSEACPMRQAPPNPTIRIRRAVAALLAAALSLTTTTLAGGVASAAPRSPAWHTPIYNGQDLGWPDCAQNIGGLGMPLPPPTWYRMMIVEVNAKYVMDENPCLATELAYARAHANMVGNYHLPDYPTPAELAQSGYWPRHCAAADLLCHTYNSGFQQGTWAVNLLRSKGTHPRFLWVDVEHRSEQDWSKNVPANVSLIKGEIAGIRSLGVQPGLYSYTYGWREITGDWQAGLPQWVTIGRSTSAAARVARCSRAGFTTGPVVMVQSTTGAFDMDSVCPGFSRSMSALFAPNVSLPDPLAPYKGITIGPGSSGPAVQALQWATWLPTTGRFDARTKAAVVAVQRRIGTRADGRVRPSTWRAVAP